MGTIRIQSRSLAVDWAAWMVHGLFAVAAAVPLVLLAWYLRRQQRFDLAGLDDRALEDVGLTRADVAREADKPFWR